MTAPERPENAVSRPVSASHAPEAPVEGWVVQDDWRAALAAQLEEQFSYAAQYATVVLDWDEEADEILPAVRRIVAAELRAAAEDSTHWRMTHEAVYVHLDARADRLDATPDHGKA